MSEESFLLVSLKEDKAKKLAQVLSNDTSRKILEFISKNETATETELAKELSIPLSTVHYNIKHLTEAGLLNDDKFNYSQKGKEIIHYSLSNKYVIIAPNNTEGLKEKLKKILPVIGVIAVGSYFVSIFSKISNKSLSVNKVVELVPEATMYADEVAGAAREAIAEQVVKETIPDIAIWFFIGGIFSLIVYYIWIKIYKKIRK